MEVLVVIWQTDRGRGEGVLVTIWVAWWSSWGWRDHYRVSMTLSAPVTTGAGGTDGERRCLNSRRSG